MRITDDSVNYYPATVTLDGTEVADFYWADEETGEVLARSYGDRNSQGFRRQTAELLKGKVSIRHW